MHKRYDAILILGNGLNSDMSLPERVVSRLERAMGLASKTTKFLTLSAGTVHKPFVVDLHGSPVYESVAAADYLIDKGISRERIRADTVSLDTIGNAFFARLLFCEPMNLKKIAIVTSEFHMSRTKLVFDFVFGLKNLDFDFDLDYYSVSDSVTEQGLLNAKQLKEEESIESFMKIMPKFSDFGEFHDWIYTKHEAYSVGLKPKRLTGEILKGY